jgi:excisionase family DNA binding protein
MSTRVYPVVAPPASGTLDTPAAILGSKLLFSVEEAAAFCGRSKPWLYRLMGSGRIRFVRLGPRRAITRREVLRITTEGVN